MSSPEGPTFVRENEHMRLLLRMIEDTHTMQFTASHYTQMEAATNMPFSHFGVIARLAQTEIAANAAAINQSLREIGGISHYYVDTATQIRVGCVLEEWHGLDPSQTENHLWKIKGMPGQSISFTPDVIEELRQTLL